MKGRGLAGAAAALFVAVLLVPRSAQAECPSGQDELIDLVNAATVEILEEVDVEGEAAVGAIVTPPAAPNSEQNGAPTASGSSVDLVDGASFAELAGLALNQSLEELGSAPITLTINPFAVATLGNREALWNNEVYQEREYELLRRFAGTITTGGEGQAFDRDGDGEPDEALKAENVDDIVTWEFRYRLLGSRDRRDAANTKRFFGELDRALQGRAKALVGEDNELFQQLFKVVISATGGERCLDPETWSRFRADHEVDRILRRLADVEATVRRAFDAAAEIVDNRAILTLALGGVSRAEGFGADERFVALRGAFRGGTANLEYRELDDLAGDTDPTSWKFALQYATLWGSDLTASASAAYERFEHMPEAMHDEVAQVGVKLEYELAEGIKLPLSVTWANHPDLLSDEDEVRGHIGFTLSLGELLKPDVVEHMLAAQGK